MKAKPSLFYEMLLLLVAIYLAVVIGLQIKMMADRCTLGYCEIQTASTVQQP